MRSVSILLALVAVAVLGTLAVRFEGTPPEVETLEGPVPVGQGYGHEVWVSDPESGVESIRAWVETSAGERVLFEKKYPGNPLLGADRDSDHRVSVPIPVGEQGFADGPIALQIEVRDYSLRGNRSTREVTLDIDTKAPRVSVLTGLTYVRFGGSEAALYRINEDVRTDGIEVGEARYPGFSHPSLPGTRIAFYALDPDGDETTATVFATDPAGNQSRVPLTIGVIRREFPSDRINLSEPFLQRKVAELGQASDASLIERYLALNRGLREESHRQLREITADPSPERLWQGRFAQLPNSKVLASFGDRRSYLFAGEKVDEQTHLGYDLASTRRAAVPAGNHGVVAFAGPLGIYGNTVVIDHGLGVFSLYGHLSEISVEAGSRLQKGESVGRTGQSGLAGGDHLHFSMLVHGEFVDPLEWFDAKWIREHLEPKFAAQPKPDSAAASGS